jgi:hypothetical protein
MINAIERRVAERPIWFRAGAVETIGHVVLRYGLVLFLVTGGLAKFASSEAEFIQPLMAHSPFIAWLYAVTSVQGASNLILSKDLILPGAALWATGESLRVVQNGSGQR